MKLIIFLLLTVSAWGQWDIAPPETIKCNGMTVIVGYDKCEWDTTMKWGGDFYIQQSTYGKEPASIHYVRLENKEEHHFDRELLTLNRLIYFWDTYKAECWADSGRDTLGMEWTGGERCDSIMRADSIEFYKKYGDNNWEYDWGYPSCCFSPVLSEWTHRSPDPFEFIDKYLRKKVKQ